MARLICLEINLELQIHIGLRPKKTLQLENENKDTQVIKTFSGHQGSLIDVIATTISNF